MLHWANNKVLLQLSVFFFGLLCKAFLSLHLFGWWWYEILFCLFLQMVWQSPLVLCNLMCLHPAPWDAVMRHWEHSISSLSYTFCSATLCDSPQTLFFGEILLGPLCYIQKFQSKCFISFDIYPTDDPSQSTVHKEKSYSSPWTKTKLSDTPDALMDARFSIRLKLHDKSLCIWWWTWALIRYIPRTLTSLNWLCCCHTLKCWGLSSLELSLHSTWSVTAGEVICQMQTKAGEYEVTHAAWSLADPLTTQVLSLQGTSVHSTSLKKLSLCYCIEVDGQALIGAN